VEKFIKFILSTYLNLINRWFPKLGGKHAFLVFCHPFPVKLKKHQQAFLDHAEQWSTEFEGKKIAGYRWGNGKKKVLCLHGWGSSTYRWKKFVQHLSELDYTIDAIDAPAHGKSEGTLVNVPKYANLIGQLIEAESYDFILAHSLGAFSTICLFYENENVNVKKIVAMGMPSEAKDFMAFFAEQLKLKPHVIKNFADYFRAYANKEPDYYSGLKFAEKQRAKGLIIHDVDDDEAPYDYAVKVAKTWPNAELMTTEGLGHKLRSLDVVRRVVRFLEED
jgi:pimeloyl-ACP methyl ester carboxylesterase